MYLGPETTAAEARILSVVRYYIPVSLQQTPCSRKNGVWSDWLAYRPLQVQLLVDQGTSHLATAQLVEDLCPMRTMLEHMRVLKVQDRLRN